MSTYSVEFSFAIATAIEAGNAIRRLYESNSARTYIKADESPVTDADLASDRIIRQRVAERFPDDAILTEEGIDNDDRLSSGRVWIADPIDGTQQYMKQTGQFDVLLALVVGGRPVVSVAVQPVTGIYLSAEIGQGAWIGTTERPERERLLLAKPSISPRLVTTTWFGAPESTFHLGRIVHRAGFEQPEIFETGVIARGHMDPETKSLAGRPDRQLAFGYASPAHAMVGLPMRGDGTMAWEWDYCASDLLISEAGGRFTDWYGKPFLYNKPMPRNEGGLIIANTPSLHQELLDAIQPEIELVNASRREK